MASRALNCDFYANNLRPVYGVSLVAGLRADIKTIYKLKDSWLSWPGVVNIAESFVHDSGGRIAFTGSGLPKRDEYNPCGFWDQLPLPNTQAGD